MMLEIIFIFIVGCYPSQFPEKINVVKQNFLLVTASLFKVFASRLCNIKIRQKVVSGDNRQMALLNTMLHFVLVVESGAAQGA